MHITSSVFINDDEGGLHHDFGKWLEQLAPFNPDPNHYHHNRTGEDNADAHLKRQIMGREVVVAITKGKSTSARGSKSSTASSTAIGTSGCWSRSSGSRLRNEVPMKYRVPGFKKCMAMMRKRDPQTQEDGFQLLLPHAGEHVHELIEEFGQEKAHGLRCWLLELIGSAKSPDAFEFLAGHLRDADDRFRFWAIWGLKNLGTKESRTLLWQARSFTLASPVETEAFRSDLDTVLNKQDW